MLSTDETLQAIAKLIGDMTPIHTPTASIGIGITTHNRSQQFNKTYSVIRELAPLGAKIVVVDDCSASPVPEATYRFNENVGIARAKNKCLELLQDCDHIFLFDDDTYPTSPDWYKPYIESGEPHLMYIFADFKTGQGRLNDTTVLYSDSKIIAYSHPRGCMLYLTKEALRAVGGMRPEFGKWGYEHPDLSNRIFNKGLTRFRFMDVVGSEKLFYSGDEHRSVNSSVSDGQRSQMVNKNKPLYEAYYYSDDYVDFMEGAKRNIVLTCFFTGVDDPQRGAKWVAADLKEKVGPLADSVAKHGWEFVMLHDIHAILVPGVKVQTSINPYFQRWISYYEYLLKHKHELADVFCVDATDVEMINAPHKLKPGLLYTGYESEVLNCEWMLNNHKSPEVVKFIATNHNRMLLNAGVVGGDVDTMLEFVRMMVDNYCSAVANAHQLKVPGPGNTDMGIFNLTASRFRCVSSAQVTTVFKANERNNYSWFKHK